MSTVTVNISFQDRLLANIDRIAQRESRSRSELLREAARIYIERKERWNNIFAKTSIIMSESMNTLCIMNISPGDVFCILFYGHTHHLI